ncbi:hypothetical protein HD554DRAFT_2035808 [Boletus coccyginus]|nr:hypothetical protein HD554DRAFT_2035808 [Boletus coccyginus]
MPLGLVNPANLGHFRLVTCLAWTEPQLRPRWPGKKHNLFRLDGCVGVNLDTLSRSVGEDDALILTNELNSIGITNREQVLCAVTATSSSRDTHLTLLQLDLKGVLAAMSPLYVEPWNKTPSDGTWPQSTHTWSPILWNASESLTAASRVAYQLTRGNTHGSRIIQTRGVGATKLFGFFREPFCCLCSSMVRESMNATRLYL